MSKKISKKDLFIELASPNKKGISGWVDVSCFTGKYSPLALGNGASWCRKESSLCKEYKVKFDKKQTPGNKIDRIKLNGKNTISNSSYPIRKDIKDEIKKENV